MIGSCPSHNVLTLSVPGPAQEATRPGQDGGGVVARLQLRVLPGGLEGKVRGPGRGYRARVGRKERKSVGGKEVGRVELCRQGEGLKDRE